MRITFKTFFIIVLAIFLQSNTAQSQILNLEDFNLFKEIKTIDILDHNLLVGHENQLYHIHLTDSTLTKLGRMGKGPFEYGRIDIAKMSNRKAFVWDGSSYKLIAYNLDGSNDKEFIINTKSFVKDFFINDSLFITYNPPYGSLNVPMVRVFDLKSGALISKFGQPTPLSTGFFMEAWLSPFYLKNDELIFSNPDDFSMNKINLLNWSNTEIKISSAFYKAIIPIPKKQLDQPGYYFDEVANFVHNNNFIKSIHLSEHEIAVLIFGGEMKRRRVGLFRKGNDPSDKFSRLIIMNKLGEVKQVFERAWFLGEDHSKIVLTNNMLVQVLFSENKYTFNEISALIKEMKEYESLESSLVNYYPINEEALLQNGWKNVTANFK